MKRTVYCLLTRWKKKSPYCEITYYRSKKEREEVEELHRECGLHVRSFDELKTYEEYKEMFGL